MADKVFARSCISSSTSTSSRCVSSSPLSLAFPRENDHHRSSSAAVFPTSSTVFLLQAPALVIPGGAPPRQHGQAARAKVTCLFGGEKRDAARKALESALGEKKEAFSKWDEEIKKREASGGGGSKGRGRGWGGGGSGGGDDSSFEGSGSGNQQGEAIQVVYAFVGLSGLYLVLTKGSSMLAFILNSVLYVSRGFKPRPTPRYAPVGHDGSESAESHVRNKWGSDD